METVSRIRLSNILDQLSTSQLSRAIASCGRANRNGDTSRNCRLSQTREVSGFNADHRFPPFSFRTRQNLKSGRPQMCNFYAKPANPCYPASPPSSIRRHQLPIATFSWAKSRMRINFARKTCEVYTQNGRFDGLWIWVTGGRSEPRN